MSMNGCSSFVKENYCTVVAFFDVQPEIQPTLFSFELGQGPSRARSEWCTAAGASAWHTPIGTCPLLFVRSHSGIWCAKSKMLTVGVAAKPWGKKRYQATAP